MDLLDTLAFDQEAILRGSLTHGLSPEFHLSVGRFLGTFSTVGIGHSGGEVARMLARCVGCGVVASGGDALLHDGPNPASGAWMAQRYQFPVSIFIQQAQDRLFLHFFNVNGRPLDVGTMEQLETYLKERVPQPAQTTNIGTWDYLTGVTTAYSDHASRATALTSYPISPVAVSVTGDTLGDKVLIQALERMGCVVLRKRAQGVPAFALSFGGLRLSAWDESGTFIPPEQLLTAVSFIEFDQGGGTVALPQGAPHAISELAEQFKGRVLWLNQGDVALASQYYNQLPWLRDGVFGACRICARLGHTGERLRTLLARLPSFAFYKVEVPLKQHPEKILHAIHQHPQPEQGHVWVSALHRRPSLRVLVESHSAELAEELATSYHDYIKALDKSL